MDTNQYKINIKELKLEMSGDSCEACRPFCQAMCCRFPWNVRLDQQEFLSGCYDALQICSLSDKACDKTDITCEFRTYQLKKNENKSCIYLDEHSLCSIYDTRPQACRAFTCTNTFNLSPGTSSTKPEKIDRRIAQTKFIETINDKEVFISHPLVRLITVFYQKEQARLYFVKELIGGCGKFYSDNDFNYPKLDDEQILWLIRFFDKKEPLNKIYKQFQEQFGSILSEKEFIEIVWILLKHKLIISTSYLGPLLKGTGI